MFSSPHPTSYLFLTSNYIKGRAATIWPLEGVLKSMVLLQIIRVRKSIFFFVNLGWD